MGMSYNLNLIYGIELPDDSEIDDFTYPGLEIHSEGEIGTRRFIGIQLREYNSDSGCEPFTIPSTLMIDQKIRDQLFAISDLYDLDEPELWTVGNVS